MKQEKIQRILNRLTGILIFAISIIILISCEDYLDKAPEASISQKDVYGSFESFQGFVEEMYNCLPNYNRRFSGNLYYNMNCADDVLSNRPIIGDDGNYWGFNYIHHGSINTNLDPISKRTWPLAWYGIRKANLAIANINFLTDATQEEKNFIEGQAYFFRGWFHFELSRWWGGLPYVDTVLSSSDKLHIAKLNYRETALKAASDFKKAATLLPLNWDDTNIGKRTFGDNQDRITKIHALSYAGKALLYTASPMMNEESTGNNSYNAELCKEAAVNFAEVIKICNETGVFQLQPWESYTDIFWVWSPGRRERPGGMEVIMNQTIYNFSYTRWTSTRSNSPVQFGAGNNSVEVPTHNYVKNYRMANGLPIDDPNSGFDPNDPWSNREPRFYIHLYVDGDKMVESNAAGDDQYAQLYNGGRHKGGNQGSVTGYYVKKYTPLGCNSWDNRWNDHLAFRPWMRLADVYLMYAEAALHGYGSSSSGAPGSLTAVEALNTIRNRAQLPDLTSDYLSNEKFMEAIITERAVELAYENGARFHDLRRWNISGELKYRQKTAIDFDRGPDGKPINLMERVVLERVFEKKHNWLPFPVADVNLYWEFQQNPGW